MLESCLRRNGINKWFDLLISQKYQDILQNIQLKSKIIERRRTNTANKILNGFAAIHYACYYNDNILLSLVLNDEIELLTKKQIQVSKIFIPQKSSCLTISLLAQNLSAITLINKFVLDRYQYVKNSNLFSYINENNNKQHILLLATQYNNVESTQILTNKYMLENYFIYFKNYNGIDYNIVFRSINNNNHCALEQITKYYQGNECGDEIKKQISKLVLMKQKQNIIGIIHQNTSIDQQTIVLAANLITKTNYYCKQNNLNDLLKHSQISTIDISKLTSCTTDTSPSLSIQNKVNVTPLQIDDENNTTQKETVISSTHHQQKRQSFNLVLNKVFVPDNLFESDEEVIEKNEKPKKLNLIVQDKNANFNKQKLQFPLKQSQTLLCDKTNELAKEIRQTPKMQSAGQPNKDDDDFDINIQQPISIKQKQQLQIQNFKSSHNKSRFDQFMEQDQYEQQQTIIKQQCTPKLQIQSVKKLLINKMNTNNNFEIQNLTASKPVIETYKNFNDFDVDDYEKVEQKKPTLKINNIKTIPEKQKTVQDADDDNSNIPSASIKVQRKLQIHSVKSAVVYNESKSVQQKQDQIDDDDDGFNINLESMHNKLQVQNMNSVQKIVSMSIQPQKIDYISQKFKSQIFE